MLDWAGILGRSGLPYKTFTAGAEKLIHDQPDTKRTYQTQDSCPETLNPNPVPVYNMTSCSDALVFQKSPLHPDH